MGRSKKLDRVIAARVQALRDSNMQVLVDGRKLEPGTAEHERQLEKMARSLSDDELGLQSRPVKSSQR